MMCMHVMLMMYIMYIYIYDVNDVNIYICVCMMHLLILKKKMATTLQPFKLGGFFSQDATSRDRES